MEKCNFLSSLNFILICKIFLSILFISCNNLFKRKKLDKICLCTVAKEENKYIREFILHYKNYDVDKIYIFDNNDKNGENFEDVIGDYIRNGFVELIDFKEIPQPQLKAYNECYKRYNKLYDWLIFYDVDEFIYLKDFKSLKLFLNNERFDKCNRVQLNWIFYTDNNLLYYENKPSKERFTEREPNARGKEKGGPQGIKSIIRGNMKNIEIICPHTLSENTISCNGFGKRKKVQSIITLESDFKYYYISHYACKSTEEFIINKLKKTDVYHKIDNNMEKIKWYFAYNKITKAKIDLIENKTRFNLTIYRGKIKN